MSQLSVLNVVIRLLLAVIFSGIIGLDRAYKHRPAGLRTHILVCLGACIIAMIQKNIGFDALEMARQYPQYKGVLRADDARLIAQVVSGIGFLGAGTIIVEHHSIRGLTTAASLWVVACLGIAIGMGDYIIAIVGFLVVYAVLGFLKKIIKISPVRKLKIEYKHKLDTKKFIDEYFQRHDITVEGVRFSVSNFNDTKIYTNVYSIDFGKNIDYVDIVEGLSMNENVIKVETINV
ncbi:MULTISPECIES: MgtC/SapB family protein [Companilactobacillus]|uniref:Protein MgtC n=1 Tax=Companilactobacillus bobalius TaxID=2801451 RepID=A0A202FFU2_9LACO|nr:MULTISPECIES: MgtC/SapB family protein [Companilactobacillus]MDR4933856.1 MgtC/SapB family protein [Companilactobacillus paralimentarius]OVE99312.1 Protein MgtC [Companilactobacillus bobalius]GEO57290.1 magnesium transporter MgtC [Companilactobacillus paralimentarius]